MLIKHVLIAGCGGFIGASLRYVIGFYATKMWGKGFYGTLLVNILGCFLLGLLMGLESKYLSFEMRLLLQTGMLGALTTFSTFISDIFLLLEKKQIGWMLCLLALHLFVGFIFFWLGYKGCGKK